MVQPVWFTQTKTVNFILMSFLSCGFFQIDPNTAKVITYYGKYLGTVKKQGYYWINPFYSQKTVSLKSNNLLSEVIKVNDKQGNPIMMGCCVVWRVKDTAKAIFDVQNYNVYVRVQSESAIRYIGCMYPYDKTTDNENEICLRSGHDEINKVLKDELTERLVKAGIKVMEAKVTELSYAAEIANNMLKRQAAEAIIAAREKIVQGAVSITGHAIQSLKDNNIIELNEDNYTDMFNDNEINPYKTNAHFCSLWELYTLKNHFNMKIRKLINNLSFNFLPREFALENIKEKDLLFDIEKTNAHFYINE